MRSWCLCLVAVSCAACNDAATRGGLVLMVAGDGSLQPDGLRLTYAAPEQSANEARWAVPDEAELPVTITLEAKPGSTTEVTIDGSLWKGNDRLDRRTFTIVNIPKDRYAAVPLLFGARCAPSNPAAPVCSGQQTCNPEDGTCVASDLDASELPDYEPGLEATLTWEAPSGADAGETSAGDAAVSDATAGSERDGGHSNVTFSETSRPMSAATEGGTASLDAGTGSGSRAPQTTEPTTSATGDGAYASTSSPFSGSVSLESSGSTSDPTDTDALCTYGSYFDDGECRPWQSCDAGHYVLAEGTDELDRICQPCPPETFSAASNSPACSPFTHCGFRQQQSDGSPIEDVTCAPGDVVLQFGSEEGDTASGVAVDAAGSVYVVGYTDGALFAENAGGWDAFVQKRTQTGVVAWSEQFGTSTYDRAHDVVANANGDVTVVGSTEGDLAEGAAAFADLFLRRYHADGDVAWTIQYGTPNLDMAYSVVETAAGSLVVTGRTYGAFAGYNADGADFFVSSFSATGAHEWSQQIGSDDADFRGSSITVDAAGDIVAVGNTVAGFGGDDVTLLKLTSEGVVVWQKSFGSNAEDVALAVATDEDDNIYVAGYSYGRLGATDLQGVDAWVSKRNAAGELLWIDQFGTNAEDAAMAVAVHESALYVAGQWGNESNLADDQVFVRRYDLDGTDAVTHVIGTSTPEYGYGLAVTEGRIFVSGDTSGDFGATNAGRYDAFLTQVVLP